MLPRTEVTELSQKDGVALIPLRTCQVDVGGGYHSTQMKRTAVELEFLR